MFKKALFLVLFLCLVSSVIVFSVYQGVFNITKINILVADKNQNYESHSLLKSATEKLNSFKGTPIFLFSLGDAYKKLSLDPRIEEVKLKRNFPNQINIQIKSKEVSASMMSYKYGLHSLTNVGDVLPVKLSKQSIDLPILRGTNFHKDKKLRLMAVELLREIPKKGLFSKENISEIRYDKKNGFIIYLNGYESIVKVGKKHYKKKSSYIERVMSYLESQKMEGRVIDARYSKKVVVKLRNEP